MEQIAYPDSPRIGRFSIRYEVLRDGRERPMLQALFGLCVVLDASEDESGRGKEFFAASDLFQPLLEGEEIPKYRIEAWPGPAETEPNAERAAQCLRSGAFRFAAIRQVIVRVPPINLTVKPQVVH